MLHPLEEIRPVGFCLVLPLVYLELVVDEIVIGLHQQKIYLFAILHQLVVINVMPRGLLLTLVELFVVKTLVLFFILLVIYLLRGVVQSYSLILKVYSIVLVYHFLELIELFVVCNHKVLSLICCLDDLLNKSKVRISTKVSDLLGRVRPSD